MIGSVTRYKSRHSRITAEAAFVRGRDCDLTFLFLRVRKDIRKLISEVELLFLFLLQRGLNISLFMNRALIFELGTVLNVIIRLNSMGFYLNMSLF